MRPRARDNALKWSMPVPREIRMKTGEKPPETIEYEGRRYRPMWIDVTTASDKRAGEQVFVIGELGKPIEGGSEADVCS